MRTTLNLEEDVLARARSVAGKRKTAFKKVVNEALRAGLDQIEHPRERLAYRTKPHNMGLRKGMNLDNIQEVLAHIEGENFR